jgi:aconitate hydratase
VSKDTPFEHNPGDWIYIPGVKKAILSGVERIPAKVIKAGINGQKQCASDTDIYDITLELKGLSQDERVILIEGCLMNYYAQS